MTIADDISQMVQATIERRTSTITLFRKCLRAAMPGNELDELNAVFSWERDAPQATLRLNATIILVRATKWLDRDNGEHIRVDEYFCVPREAIQSGGLISTVPYSRIRGAVLLAFATEEARKRESEIIPSENDDQSSA